MVQYTKNTTWWRAKERAREWVREQREQSTKETLFFSIRMYQKQEVPTKTCIMRKVKSFQRYEKTSGGCTPYRYLVYVYGHWQSVVLMFLTRDCHKWVHYSGSFGFSIADSMNSVLYMTSRLNVFFSFLLYPVNTSESVFTVTRETTREIHVLWGTSCLSSSRRIGMRLCVTGYLV